MEWNVPACTSLPGSPTSRMIRSRSSAAARFVKVTARIRHGATPLDADQVRDPMGQHARLARARSRENQHGTFGGRDRARLLRVQPAEDLLPPGVRDLRLVSLLRRLRGRVAARLRVERVRAVGEPRRFGEGLRRDLRDLLEPGAFRFPPDWRPPASCSGSSDLLRREWRSNGFERPPLCLDPQEQFDERAHKHHTGSQ